MKNFNIKNRAKSHLLLAFLSVVYNFTFAQSQATPVAYSCYDEISLGVTMDLAQFDPQITTFCQNVALLNSLAEPLILRANQRRLGNSSLKLLDEMSRKIGDIKKSIDTIKQLNSAGQNPEALAVLTTNLNTTLNSSITLYYQAVESYYRSRQDLAKFGSFLIGSVGYLKIIGENKYAKDGNNKDSNNQALRLKIIQPTVPNILNLDATLKSYCLNGYAVSFVQERNASNFFDQNERLLINTDNVVSVLNKQNFKENTNSVFCIAAQGDGYRLYTKGDWFLNDVVDGMTRDSNHAGTFVFVSEVGNVEDFILPTVGNFRMGNQGYISKKSPLMAPEYLNFKPQSSLPPADNIKFKIAEPIFDPSQQNICEPRQLLTFEALDEANQTTGKVLSFNELGLTLHDKDKLVTTINKKRGSFCLERIGNYFRIKNLFGAYISNQVVNSLIAMEDSAGEFDFSHNYLTSQDLQQGDVGRFTFYQEGYIKLTNEQDKYVALAVNNNAKVLEPVKLKVIPPLETKTRNICADNNIAVSLEFAHDPEFILSREEWQFKKVSKYGNNNSKNDAQDELNATFCIEKKSDHYLIQAAGGYYLDNTGLGFTKDIDNFAEVDFVENIVTNSEEYTKPSSLTDQATGYLKSSRDIYLNTRDINNLEYYMPKIKILKSEDITNANCADAEAIKIINTVTSDYLTSFYDGLYFINRYMRLPNEMTTFCARQVEDRYVIFSALPGVSPMYLTANANRLSPDIKSADQFSFQYSLPKIFLESSYAQGDVGRFRINNIGYLKLTDKNVYINAKQHREVFNSKEDLALKFKIISPVRNLETQWCHESMAIMLQDNYNPDRVLAYNKNTMELVFTPITDEANYRNMVFCLDVDATKKGAKIKTFNGYYIDGINANALTNNPALAGRFTLVNNLLDLGLGSISYMNKAAGKSLKAQFKTATPGYLKFDAQNKLAITNQVSDAAGFTVMPGLANASCISLKDVLTNKYMVYTQSVFIKQDFNSSLAYATQATFCPIFHPIDQAFSFYLLSDPQQYLTLSKNILTTVHSQVVPTDNNSVFILANKRELIEKAQNVSQLLTNVDCRDLAPNGKIVNVIERDQKCGSLQSLRAIMRHDLQSIDVDQQCCSHIVFLNATGSYPKSAIGDCLVTYDAVCVKDDPSIPNFMGNEFLY